MEPERNIEKRLRAFAKKRRADAGDPLKLHPATRRQLQAEVARRHAETPEEDSVSLWQFFRQQWAFLLSFALVIFFGAALFLPALSKAKHKAKSAVAMNQPASVAAAGAVTTDSDAGGRNGFGHGVASRDAATGPAGASAISSVSNENLEVREEPEQKLLFRADAPAADGLSGLSNNSQRFRQTLAVAAKMPPVLASFEVRQNGNALAVVDRDGSVYSGFIQPEMPAAQSVPPAAAVPPAEKDKDASALKSERPAAQSVLAQNNYFFRVAGQNRTSKQNVVFVGNMIPLTNTLLNASQNQPGRSAGFNGALLLVTNNQNSRLQSALFSNVRITGTVTVDATNRMEINAMPVAP